MQRRLRRICPYGSRRYEVAVIHALYQILSGYLDVKAASRGPGPYVRRRVRRSAHKQLARSMRRMGL